jgi:streptogramin lyase/DNA-directed RNA polymerase subunit RPC12/RpoP
MTESFKCPSCSAPLEFEGKPVQKCRFCGSSVIVPVGTIQNSGAFGGFGAMDFGDLSSLTGRALKIAEIQKLIQSGNKIGAIKVFRETFGTSLEEAKNAVEAMERGESVDISGMRVQTTNLPPTTIDLRPLKKVGVAVGGSIFVAVIGVGVVIIGAAIAIFFLVSKSTNDTLDRTFVSNGTAISNDATKTPGKPKLAEEVLRFGGEGNGAGKFTDNRHVAVDGNGLIYSSDYQGGKIQVFDAAGKYVTQWIVDPKMNLYELKADRKGNLYVLNNKGIFVYKGASGELVNKAENYDFKGMTLTLDGKLIVATSKGFTIFDGNLKPLQEFKDSAERANATFGFEDVAADGNNQIYAVDRQKGDICIFSADGKFLNRFKTKLTTSRPIAIDNKGRIFVSDVSHIYAFDAEGKQLNSFDTTQAFGMSFNAADELFVAARPFVVKYKINF